MSDIDRDAAVRDALLQLACIAHRREPTPDMEFAAQQLPDLILRALGIDVPDGNAEWLLNGDQLARVHTNLRAAVRWSDIDRDALQRELAEAFAHKWHLGRPDARDLTTASVAATLVTQAIRAARAENERLRDLLRKVRDRLNHDDGSGHPWDHALFDIKTMLIMADLGDGDNS